MQEGLLREHLSWQYDGLADEHIDLLIFVAVALRLEEVNREMATTQRQSDTKNHTELRPRLERLELDRLQALTLLGRLSARGQGHRGVGGGAWKLRRLSHRATSFNMGFPVE